MSLPCFLYLIWEFVLKIDYLEIETKTYQNEMKLLKYFGTISKEKRKNYNLKAKTNTHIIYYLVAKSLFKISDMETNNPTNL